MALLFYLYQSGRLLARERVFRDRSRPLDFLSDDELVEYYRFRRHDIIAIIRVLEDVIAPLTDRSCAIPAEVQVLVTLRLVSLHPYFYLVVLV
jgi:hypothetical protein